MLNKDLTSRETVRDVFLRETSTYKQVGPVLNMHPATQMKDLKKKTQSLSYELEEWERAKQTPC